MHEIRIASEIVAQVHARRGRAHPFDRLDPGRIAHIAVDLQNGFIEPGAPNLCPRMSLEEPSRAGGSNGFGCCESIARDAMQMHYEVVLVSDATATFCDATHHPNLEHMVLLSADVLHTGEVLTAIGSG